VKTVWLIFKERVKNGIIRERKPQGRTEKWNGIRLNPTEIK
jgi:hypothetical protein